MAENKSIQKFSGTLGDLTYVHQYGKHTVRAKRGTYKKATVNAIMNSFTDRNAIISATAKPINDALKEYAGIFKESAFWSNLQKRLRKCEHDDLRTHLNSLQGMEVNAGYPFDKWFERPFSYAIIHDGEGFTVSFGSAEHPQFRIEHNCLLYDVVVFQWKETSNHFYHQHQETAWAKPTDQPAHYAMHFYREPGATHYMVLIKATGGVNRHVNNGLSGTGMKVFEVGVF